MSGAATPAEWDRVLGLLRERRVIPDAVAAHARELLASRPGSELTPTLVSFWVDVPEGLLSNLLAEVRSQAPTVRGAGAPADAPLELPATLGPYEVEALLGGGGMGRVYRAREVALGRSVALKLLAPALAADPEARRRFLREARALAHVSHPNVVTCFAAGEIEGRPFIAMELLEGGDAHGLARAAGGRLDERRALELARDAARGLAALAAAGLVHRDVKPTNILIGPGGQAKLGDLGLARSASGAEDRLTLTGVAVGTLAFMAPEQLEGSAKLDARADVYALGATLSVLLSGVLPGPGQGARADLDALCSGVSPATLALIRRAMARDPARRHAGPEAMLEALESALAARGRTRAPHAAPPRSVPRVATVAATRSRALPLVVASIFAAGSLGALWPRGGAPPVAPPAPLAAPPAPLSPPVVPSTPPPAPAPPPTTVPRGEAPVRFVVSPENGTVAARADGMFVATPGSGDWSRAGLFDAERRRLPLRVRWTLTAEVARDAATAADWERAQGFREAAGFFFEVGLRARNDRIEAARDLSGGAWWVCLQWRRDGRVLGLVRDLNRDKPPGEDLVAVPGPGRAATAGVAILARFELPVAAGAALELETAFDARGWRLDASSGAERRPFEGAWDAGPAPLRDELAGDVFLWGHMGNWSSGVGRGTLAARVASD